MLQSLKHLYGKKLLAADGEIGHVNDFYFDDQNWAVRYVVVDTGSWLPGRQIILSPHAFGALLQSGKDLVVNRTRKQIEESPAMEAHKPISRQQEEEHYRYYGWPQYWQGEGLWGMSGFPILELPPLAQATIGAPAARPDAHLRSTRAVDGYHVKTSDGTPGHVCDFMMDTQSWAIGELRVKTGHRFSGTDVSLPVRHVARVSYEESTVYANLSSAVLEQSPAHSVVSA